MKRSFFQHTFVPSELATRAHERGIKEFSSQLLFHATPTAVELTRRTAAKWHFDTTFRSDSVSLKQQIIAIGLFLWAEMDKIKPISYTRPETHR